MLKKTMLLTLGLVLCLGVSLSASHAATTAPEKDNIGISFTIDASAYPGKPNGFEYHLNIPSIGVSKVVPMNDYFLHFNVSLPLGTHKVTLSILKGDKYLGMATAQVKIDYVSQFTKIVECTEATFSVLVDTLCHFNFHNAGTWISYRAKLKK